MTRRLLILRPVAKTQLASARSWWSRNRDKAPSAFDEDIEEAFTLITEQPLCGTPARTRRRKHIRRLLVERIRYYLYYRVTDTFIEVVAIWHASRRPPKL